MELSEYLPPSSNARSRSRTWSSVLGSPDKALRIVTSLTLYSSFSVSLIGLSIKIFLFPIPLKLSLRGRVESNHQASKAFTLSQTSVICSSPPCFH